MVLHREVVQRVVGGVGSKKMEINSVRRKLGMIDRAGYVGRVKMGADIVGASEMKMMEHGKGDGLGDVSEGDGM